MKNAFILNPSELTGLLRSHLKGLGFNADHMQYETLASGSIVVTNVAKAGEEALTYGAKDGFVLETDPEAHIQDNITEAVRGRIENGEVFSIGSLATAMGVSLHAITVALEALDVDIDEVNENAKIRNVVLDAIADAPRSVQSIVNLLEGVSGYRVNSALEGLGNQVAKVCAAREDGQTVSAWMKTSTIKYGEFVEGETARINTQVDELKDAVLNATPKFYERRGDRMEIVARIIEQGQEEAPFIGETAAEGIRKDCRSVFYRMAELGLLEHKSNGWRAGKTDADRINVSSLQGAIREVLMQADGDLSRDGIAGKLPGFVNDSLIRHAVMRMDDVYEQGGLLHLTS